MINEWLIKYRQNVLINSIFTLRGMVSVFFMHFKRNKNILNKTSHIKKHMEAWMAYGTAYNITYGMDIFIIMCMLN